MARPMKWRKIEHIPTVHYFVPSEQEMADMPETGLKLEELEAIRLKDLEGLEQGECAVRMEVSRPTFQRILSSAREKIADSLVNGKCIHIEGGKFTTNICPIRCVDCGKEWTESYENLNMSPKSGYCCPSCGSAKIICRQNCQGRFGRKNCWRNGKKEDK